MSSDLEKAEHNAMRAAEAADVADSEYAEELDRVVAGMEADWRCILEQRGEPDCGMDEWVAWMCDDPERLAVMTRVLAAATESVWTGIGEQEKEDLYSLRTQFMQQCAREQIADNVEAGREFKRAGPRW